MEEVGYGEFGLRGTMSGLYIEKVWVILIKISKTIWIGLKVF